MKNKELLELRLNRVVNVLDNIDKFLDNLDFAIPEEARKILRKFIQSDEMQEVVKGIKEKRPPRLAFIGRSGVGKSSLINAIMGTYLAETSAVDVGTKAATIFEYSRDGEKVFEIIDTRGIKENLQSTDSSAETDLYDMISNFEPDAFLVLSNGSDRSTLREDIKYLKRLQETLNITVPLVTVVTRVDELEPSRIKNPKEYTERKINNIQQKEKQVEQVLINEGVKDFFIVPVSSYIEWSHEEPEILTPEERNQLTIEYDGRYNIDKLVDFLEKNMDFRAAIYLMMSQKLDIAIKKIAEKIVRTFTVISGTIAATPIPMSDIFILIPIQVLEVIIIAHLAGVELDSEAAREFILSVGSIGVLGLGLRFVAQQGSKLLNLVIPVSGSVISGTIAASGTYVIGQGAISYYIEGKNIDDVKDDMLDAKEHELEL